MTNHTLTMVNRLVVQVGDSSCTRGRIRIVPITYL